VTVGVHSSAGVYKKPENKKSQDEKDITIVSIARINEFGSEDGKIPERSFLRSTIKEEHDKYKVFFKKVAAKIVEEPEKFNLLMAKIGEKAKGDVQEKIRNLSEPGNAQSTIDAKGSANPLVNTGQLGSSITYVVSKKEQ